MARGWESKSVEGQQEEVAARITSTKPHMTREQADRMRETESLRLSLRNILQQLDRSRDPRRREMLEQAKTELQRKIEKLEA
jgi:predicted alpha/beta-fold hydrolase